VAEFYSARSNKTLPPLWTSFALPFTAYDHALKSGATPVSAPTEKPWGQTVSFVRDLNGCLVEIASPVRK
ncbi:MAG: hypothetical protein HRU28_18575, partial [Rhizobiales bacterium]|nr:hypothetical protein [Hyphomicrobiales bacterium]